MVRKKIFAVILIAGFFYQLSGLPGMAAVNVAIFPFQTKGNEDITYLKDGVLEIISSRIGLPGKIYVVEQSRVKEALEGKSSELSSEAMRSIGYQLDADYIIRGRLMEKGNKIKIEGNILNLKKDIPPLTFSRECSGINEVINKVSDLAEELRTDIVNSSKNTGSKFSNLSEEGAQSLQEEKIFSGEKAGKISSEKAGVDSAASITKPISSEISPRKAEIKTGKVSLNCWRSGKISNKVRGLSVGDVDGDGNKEVVLITDKKVLVYRKTEEKLKKLAEYKEKGPADFIKIDMADINGNGLDEIFITNIKENSLSSFVLEYKNKNFEKIADNLKWVLGVINFPDEGPVLLAQTYRDDNPSNKGKIYRIKWGPKGYVPAVALEKMPLTFKIPGVGVLEGTEGPGEKEFVFLDHDGRLRVLDQDGKVKWKGKRTYGGSDISFKVPLNNSSPSDEETLSLPMRLIIKDLNNSQKEDIILGKNFSKEKGLLRRRPVYENGAIYGLQWNGSDMAVRWQTERLDECVVDYSVGDADNDGKDELVVAVRSARSFFALRPKSYILIYEIT